MVRDLHPFAIGAPSTDGSTCGPLTRARTPCHIVHVTGLRQEGAACGRKVQLARARGFRLQQERAVCGKKFESAGMKVGPAAGGFSRWQEGAASGRKALPVAGMCGLRQESVA
eukprot:356994-Chlamydomonas_euryale.AAC.2